MPVINKIRLTNIVYEDGFKRINDEVYHFEGHNGAIILENGGGKTVFIHTVLQAVLPHTDLGERKIKETLQLENGPAHIGIEWMINDRPRRYVTTAVSLYLHNNTLQSLRYVFEYEGDHPDRLEKMPFVLGSEAQRYPAYKEELNEYYQSMRRKSHQARTFDTLSQFNEYIEKTYQIIKSEWEAIVKINGDEGGIERFFEHCRTTTDLYDRLLIPIVEQSIEGHEKGMFADMFEKQREGFQQYLQFKKSLAEYAAIQEQLRQYVEQYGTFHQVDEHYETLKQKAKGLLETAHREHMNTEQDLAENEQAFAKWQVAERQLQIKAESYQILQEQLKETELQTAYDTITNELTEAQDKLDRKEHEFYSLQYAEVVEKRAEVEQLLQQNLMELKTYEKDSEVADLAAQLENEHRKLHGYFLTAIDEVKKIIKEIDFEIKPLESELEKVTNQQRTQEQLKFKYDQESAKIEGQMEQIGETSERLKQNLLANPEQQTVEEQLTKWTAQREKLDQEIVRLKGEKVEKMNGLREEKERLAETEAELKKITIELSELAFEEKEMETAHQALVEKLATIRLNWQSIDVHLRGETVRHTLIQMLERLNNEREEFLYKERNAYRFIDDYGEQASFFVEPLLAKKVTHWQSEFFIEFGPNYFNNFPEEERANLANYPFWSITLVTNKATKAKLIAKINDIREEIQHPVVVVSLEEVAQFHALEHGDWIVPAHWQENMDENKFATWKNQLTEIAQAATNVRVTKENEIKQIEQIKAQFATFMEKYPNEEKERILQAIAQYKEKERFTNHEIVTLQDKIAALEQSLQQIDETMAELHDQMVGFENKMKDGNEYIYLQRRLKEWQEEIFIIQDRKERLTQAISFLERERAERAGEINGLNERKMQLNFELDKMKTDRRYEAVKSYTAKFTNESERVIEERRNALQLKIQGIQQTYDGIIARMEHLKDNIANFDKDLQRLLDAFPQLEQNRTFPADGKQLLHRLDVEIREAKQVLQTLTKNQADANENLIKQQARLKTKEEAFTSKFPSEQIYVFSENISEIYALLQTENKDLLAKRQFLNAEKSRIENQLNELATTIQTLGKYEYSHQLNSTLVTSLALTDKERTEFSYNRKKFTDELTTALEEASRVRADMLTTLQAEQDRFKHFCRNEITDFKLRERAIDGIERQKTYEAVLTFQKNMLITIREAEKYARNYISDKDRDIQSFIGQIHNHLYNVVEQLRTIPRNTRVNVDGVSKDIFRFTIPEWSEEEGKARISVHLDWILDQLESERYKDLDGIEDKGKVRKDIEMWLDTRQLLQVVMNNQVMKVICRKVTNDNKVSGRLTSWEQSNKWSGGEKWSKNMTLFLGILNFVFEKKQLKTNGKRRQAVILDNPFGKASSEHVLNPVFFIAEQLGFQIIALTAHADGKFLQDYFPINYSFRLRPAKDGKTQVMTKERTLKKAYFQDHDPAALDRLGEVEQLTLF